MVPGDRDHGGTVHTRHRMGANRTTAARRRIAGLARDAFTATRAALPSFLAHGGTHAAAAVAYRVLLSLFPLVLLVATVFGVVLTDADRRTAVVDAIVSALPVIADAGVDLDGALSTGPGQLGVLGLVSVATLLWSASAMVGSLRAALDGVFSPGAGHPFLRGKLRDVAGVLVMELLVLAAVALTVARTFVSRYAEDGSVLDRLLASSSQGGLVTGVLLPVLLLTGGLAVVYHVVPAARPGWRTVLPGAIAAAIGIRVLVEGFTFYASRFADFAAVYGSLATVIAFLVLVHLVAIVIIFGAELAAAWPARGHPPQAEPPD